jgi:hypothetical protein
VTHGRAATLADETGSQSEPLGRSLLRGGASAASTVSVTCEVAVAAGLFNLGTFAGCIQAGRARDGQIIHRMELTVVVRSVPR